MKSVQVAYWWAIEPEADGSHRVGVNTRNMRPEEMRLVDRRVQFDATVAALRDKSTRHRDDIAKYE